MDLTCEERPSDSPYVQRIWRSHSEQATPFTSVAESHWEMVVTRFQGSMTLTVRGPETQATPAYCPEEAEWVGIRFKPGAFMPNFPPKMLMDRRDVNLPEAGSQSFWLDGSAWQFPDYENADTFVDWLVRENLLCHDPVVAAVLQGEPVMMSKRTVQRRFVRAMGLTYGDVHQIRRARYATTLLKQGVSILDTVDKAGYADQPHLTRALKHRMGYTPAQILSEYGHEPLSFLFKTAPF